ncbi:hypothetical protein BYT27DRAFT_6687526 [Phlegmacium glaucopus]|nr:hypothetical protein BYT27DRAFT_6687526 [Phlegmacium glaucopus]
MAQFNLNKSFRTSGHGRLGYAQEGPGLVTVITGMAGYAIAVFGPTKSWTSVSQG